jgi:hypothetical protein
LTTKIGKQINQALLNNRIDKKEVDGLIATAKTDGKISSTEKKELQNLLATKGDKFDADAKTALTAFLGTPATNPTGPTPPPPPPVANDPKVLTKHDGTLTWNKIDGGQLFKDGVSFDDVVQGSIGDCYFVGSLAAIAKANPKAIEDCIKDNGDGTYTARFFKVDYSGKAKPEYVRIDGDVPSAGPNMSGKYGKARDQQELWVSLVEKAYASWKGGYEAIGNGGCSTDVLEAITGKGSSYQVTKGADENRMFQTIKKSVDSKIPITAGTYGKDQEAMYAGKNLYAWHNYSIVGAGEENGQKFVELRNPWGRTEPGNDGKDDGSFKLPLADFMKYYQGLNIGAPGYY